LRDGANAGNGGNQWADVELAQLASDPQLETALNLFASASQNHVLNVSLQQEKARAVIALIGQGDPLHGGTPE
jgi:hypothetical protein